jgi:hypothetical protein
VVFGDPDVVEAGLLGGERCRDCRVQHGAVVLVGELGGEQEVPNRVVPPSMVMRRADTLNMVPALPHSRDQQSRNSGLWLSS